MDSPRLGVDRNSGTLFHDPSSWRARWHEGQGYRRTIPGTRFLSSRFNGTKIRSLILSGQSRLTGLLGNLVRSVPGGDPAFRRTTKQVRRPRLADHWRFYG